MNTKEIKEILIVLNSSTMFKYPIGNKELTIKVRELESSGKIVYSASYQKWSLNNGKVR